MFSNFISNFCLIIDITYIEENFTHGDKNSLKEILHEIAMQLDDTIPKIENNIEQHSCKEVYTIVHLLKPSISIINNKAIFELLEKTEEAALENHDKLPDACREFIDRLRLLKAYIASYLAEF